MTILVVEDEVRLAAAVVAGLATEGYVAVAVGRIDDALVRLDDRGLRAIILDLGLPDGDGAAVIAAARAGGRSLPVVVLTARDEVNARVAALDAGADDYLVKPFVFAELIARLRAVLRRAEPAAQVLRVGDLEVCPGEPAVRVAGRDVLLSPRERGLLELLLAHAGRVVNRREILRDAFGYDYDPGTNIVEVHLSHLRRKLADSMVRIETLRGFGYRVAVGA